MDLPIKSGDDNALCYFDQVPTYVGTAKRDRRVTRLSLRHPKRSEGSRFLAMLEMTTGPGTKLLSICA